jgi:hypothetical protein
MMSFSANGHPGFYTHWVHDGLDWMVWAQTDPGCGFHRGGWRYEPNGCDSDNSISGYATLGLGFTQAGPPFGFGPTVPQVTFDELELWIGLIESPVDGDADDGGSLYQPPDWPWVNILKMGNLLYEMGLVGDTVDTPRVQDAVDCIERQWNNSPDPGWQHPGNVRDDEGSPFARARVPRPRRWRRGGRCLVPRRCRATDGHTER